MREIYSINIFSEGDNYISTIWLKIMNIQCHEAEACDFIGYVKATASYGSKLKKLEKE